MVERGLHSSCSSCRVTLTKNGKTNKIQARRTYTYTTHATILRPLCHHHQSGSLQKEHIYFMISPEDLCSVRENCYKHGTYVAEWRGMRCRLFDNKRNELFYRLTGRASMRHATLPCVCKHNSLIYNARLSHTSPTHSLRSCRRWTINLLLQFSMEKQFIIEKCANARYDSDK